MKNMKRLLVGILLLLLAVSVAGCQQTKEDENDREEKPQFVRVDENDENEDDGDEDGKGEDDKDKDEDIDEEDSQPTEEVAVEEEPAEELFDYGTFRDSEFWFSSGAGGWGTNMRIAPDGSFSGTYSDSDMGCTGEGYPNGTLYMSNYTGRFSKAVKVNEYTYSMQIEELNYQNTPGEEEIKNEVLYIYSEAYGVSEGKEFLIYTPDAPVDALSEDFRMWAMYSIPEGSSTLGFYGLCNVKMQYGFCESRVYN